MPLITFDFHNTLASCDSWFHLEIRDLPATVLSAMALRANDTPDEAMLNEATTRYRDLRREVMRSGIEVDAETSVATILRELGVAFDPDDLAVLIEKAMRDAMHDLSPIEGAVDLARSLHTQGFQLGVISSAVYHPFLEWALDDFGIREYFSFIVTSASSGYYKSSPRIYEHALNLVDAQPTHTVHIGDSPRWDVTTASLLGMSTVLLCADHTNAPMNGIEQLAVPSLSIPSFVGADQQIVALSASITATGPLSEDSKTSEASPLRVDILTLFPQMFVGPFDESILKRAQAKGLVDIRVHDIRTWTTDKHHTADDTPYGGGAGMVMKAPPIVEAVEDILGEDLAAAHIAITSAGGRPFTQRIAHELASCGRLVIICGHYEGIDERVSTILNADELSVGDYVMTGGELPAMVIVDTVARLIPGVIDAQSIADESHSEHRADLVEYPHYTRPAEYRGHAVPDVLLSGHHARIDTWREDQARTRTLRWRPDLLAGESGKEPTG